MCNWLVHVHACRQKDTSCMRLFMMTFLAGNILTVHYTCTQPQLVAGNRRHQPPKCHRPCQFQDPLAAALACADSMSVFHGSSGGASNGSTPLGHQLGSHQFAAGRSALVDRLRRGSSGGSGEQRLASVGSGGSLGAPGSRLARATGGSDLVTGFAGATLR